MICLHCNKYITWDQPVIYLDYGYAVHVGEWIEAWESNSFLRALVERVKQRDCPHPQWRQIYLGYMQECINCGKKVETEHDGIPKT